MKLLMDPRNVFNARGEIRMDVKAVWDRTEDGNLKPSSEWTSLVKAEQFVAAICAAAEEPATPSRPFNAALDGDGVFLFANGVLLRGRYHAALCFGSLYYSITFRSLKFIKVVPTARECPTNQATAAAK